MIPTSREAYPVTGADSPTLGSSWDFTVHPHPDRFRRPCFGVSVIVFHRCLSRLTQGRIVRTRHMNMTNHVRTTDTPHQTREGWHTPKARSHEPPSQYMSPGSYPACCLLFPVCTLKYILLLSFICFTYSLIGLIEF